MDPLTYRSHTAGCSETFRFGWHLVRNVEYHGRWNNVARRPSRQDARVGLQEKGTLTSELRARRSPNAATPTSSAGANA